VDRVHGVAQETELGQVVVGSRTFVQNAKHDALAEQRGQGRDAQVDFLAQHAEFDATVLGEPPLGDVQFGHELDAGDDRRLEMLRRRFDVVEDAVDAKPDLELLLEGFHVDVAGAALHGLLEEQVDQTDDRRLRGQILEVLDVLDVLETGHLAVTDALNNPFHVGRGAAVQPVDEVHDFRLDRQVSLDLVLGELADGIDQGVVVGIDASDAQQTALKMDREKPVELHEIDAEGVLDDRNRRDHLGDQDGDLQLQAQLLQQILLGDVTQFAEDPPDLLPRLLLQVERGLELVGADQPFFHQDIADLFLLFDVGQFNTQGRRSSF